MAENVGEDEEERPFIVAGRYELLRKIKSGGFGQVYVACDRNDPNKEFAVKLEDHQLINSQLYYENQVYNELQSGVGIPKILHFGKSHGYTALVMEKLGPSLIDLFDFCNCYFSLKTVLMLADQLIRRVWFLHRNGILHRDIKPDNFLMGTREDCNTVYVIDFGLAIKYVDPLYNKHIPYAADKQVTGTAGYISLNVNKGVEPGRRDDLESLGYIFVFLLRGELPWLGIECSTKEEKSAKILELKKSTSVKELCKDCPKEFVTYINYCRNLGFEETPDYEYLLGLFHNLFLSLNIKDDKVFDWIAMKPQLCPPI